MENENKLLRTNKVKVVGKLTNADVKTGISADGKGYVSVTATVQSNIGGRMNEYKFSFYSQQLTKDGKESQLYVTYSNMASLVNKKVQIDGDIRENRYWSEKLTQITYAQLLNGKFIKGVADATQDEASFIIGGFVVKSLIEKVNKKEEVYRYELTLGQSNYNGNGMSTYVLHIKPTDREIVNAVQGYEVGATVELNGSLNFISETITVERNNEGGFGKAVTKTFPNTQRNFFIEGGTAPIDDAEKGMYSSEDIKRLVEAYKAKDVEISSKTSGTSGNSAAPVGVVKKQTSLI